MPRRLTDRSRFSALLGLLLHLAVVAAGPWVDLRLEVEACSSQVAVLQVEGADEPPCGAGHSHEVCLIRALHAMDVPPAAAAPVVASLVLPLRPSPAPVGAPTGAPTVSSLGARAPPVA